MKYKMLTAIKLAVNSNLFKISQSLPAKDLNFYCQVTYQKSSYGWHKADL